MQTSKQESFIEEQILPAPSISLAATSSVKRIRLWDLPTRLFHWSLVVAVSVAVVSGEIGGEWIGVHAKAGLTILGLVVFRLIWGIIGSTHARFAHFAPSISKLRAYIKGQWTGVGHNPLGALSVFALLALLAAQVGTGLFSNDDIDFTGPLFNLVDQALSNRLTGLHQLFAKGLFVLLAVHVVAIGFYTLIKKDNLVKPMVTGWKEVTDGKSASKGGVLAFLVASVFSLAVVYSISDFSVRDLFSSSSPLNSTATAAQKESSQPAAAISSSTPKVAPTW